MSSLNIETPQVRLPFDPSRIREPGEGGRKLHFGQGPCNACRNCNSFVGTLSICERSNCGHSWGDHSD